MSFDRRHEFIVLLVISLGLILILLAVIGGLFLTDKAIPNWAENVLIGISSVCGLRLGDCLSALVQLASGRQVARLGEQLAAAAPAATDTAKVDDMKVEAASVEVNKK
jgi:hypothetical protein